MGLRVVFFFFRRFNFQTFTQKAGRLSNGYKRAATGIRQFLNLKQSSLLFLNLLYSSITYTSAVFRSVILKCSSILVGWLCRKVTPLR